MDIVQGAPPEQLSHLQGLTSLRLQRCQLSRFPECILSLRSLRSLELRDNRITALPAAVASLTALEQLDVTNNDLAELPSELGLMAPTLSSLMVEGNCLKVGWAVRAEFTVSRVPPTVPL
jgi:Leucine-rich repeat (LRR) protein